MSLTKTKSASQSTRHAGSAPGALGSTAQTMRLRNRSLLLSLIREHAPVSRPTLASLSGIHRSNVAVIAGILIEEGLVADTSGKARGRGRVPSLLTLEDRIPAVLGISVRPAETTGLLAFLDGRIEKMFSFATPAHPQDLVARVAEHCLGGERQLRQVFAPIRQAVLAVPGRMFSSAGLWMPDFPSYAHFPLEDRIRELLGRPVALVNGGNVAAIAALHTSPSASRSSNIAFVAVHEDGVGGGILFGGQLFSGSDGNFAGEFGHMVVDPSGPACKCGAKGCWGQLVSDQAVMARASRGTAFSQAAFHSLLEDAQAGRGGGSALLAESITILVRGLRNIAVSLNPEYILVAGEITVAWRLVEEQLAREPLFPGYAGMVLPASMPLNKLYETGTGQYGLAKIFRSTLS